jgi:hypothetical protein
MSPSARSRHPGLQPPSQTILGLVVGGVFDVLFPSNYEVADALMLPADSPHSASDLVTMTRDDHPGVLIVAHGGRFYFSATGSLGDAVTAVTLANRAVIAANDGKVKTWFHGRTVRGPTVKYALLGLLAGLGAALGFLVPPKWRVTASA